MPTPHQNRVLPTGEIVATAARGTLMGNRGILHDAAGRLGVSRWRHKAWVCCLLSFKGRRRAVMAPGAYTELFFLDEAVALAAGHRPCAECRRADYGRFRDGWTAAFGARPSAPGMDRVLHCDRVRRDRSQRRFKAWAGDLPDGAFVMADGAACLLWARHLRPFAPEGYGARLPCPAETRLDVLTPRAIVAVLAAGYRPAIHPTAAL